MVFNSVGCEVVRANFVAARGRANLRLAQSGTLLLLLVALSLEQPAPEDGHGFGPVFVLAALVLD